MADTLAGKYELLDLIWDEPTNGPDAVVRTFKRHKQGDIVELDETEAERLLAAGSVVREGEREKNQADAEAERVRALLATLPPEVRASLTDELKQALAEAADDPELQTVHTAGGLVPEGSPRYAAASSGEGTGGPDPQSPKGKLDESGAVGVNPGDGRVDLGAGAGVADAASISTDDGAKTTKNARGRS